MRFTAILKYSVIMLIYVIIAFIFVATYTYFFNSNQIMDYVCYGIVPIGIFVTSLLYAKNIKERGLLRGLEIWAVYFLIVTALKYTIVPDAEISIVKHLILIPIAILGGVIGVNIKK